MKNEIDYEAFYNKVGSIIGWDFSKISRRKKTVGKEYNHLEIIKKYVNKKTKILDIGTGGGEKLLKIAPYANEAYGIDKSVSMIKTARNNLKKSGLKNVKLILADSNNIPFNDEYFDVVFCIHAPFEVKEVKRVLKNNGIFITLQVGYKDKNNIQEVFNIVFGE